MKNIKLPVIDKKGELSGEKSVSEEFLGVQSPLTLIAQAARKFMSNQRHAGAKAKTRGEVHGSRAKVWRQKGTGRARHGDRQAPIFVGGGKSFGPTGGQNFQQKLNKKSTSKAILTVLSEKQREKKLFVLADCDFTKTKDANILIQKIREKYSLKGRVLFLSEKENIKKSFVNLAKVDSLDTKTLNVFWILRSEAVLMTPKALSFITKEKNKENETN